MTSQQVSGWEFHAVQNSKSQRIIWNKEIEPGELTATSVLVKFHAWSVNYPEVSFCKGQFPWDSSTGGKVIAGSDGAGEVVAVGKGVYRFKPGDKVVPLYYQHFLHGNAPSDQVMGSILGSSLDGTFRTQGIFDQNGLSRMPENLSYGEAATLPCSGLTAWNALYGNLPLKPGNWVLTQGTGGVSMFAIKFALAAGAIVVSTTSSKEKAVFLKDLGVQHVLNYKETPQWGKEALRLTGGRGFDHIIEVGGVKTIKESFNCVARGGSIDLIGFIAGQGENPEGLTFLEPLLRACYVRGIEVGNREQFEDMARAIEAQKIKPVVDTKVFSLNELENAFEYVWQQKHFGKVVLSL